MRIWRSEFSVDQLNSARAGTILEHLGIEFTEAGDDYLQARMPVDARTRQPAGLLHGGASVVLAESLGSMASQLCIDAENAHAVGLEVNANHIRSMTEGYAVGEARPLHIGKTTMVWDIRITNEAGKLVCVCRLTTAVRGR